MHPFLKKILDPPLLREVTCPDTGNYCNCFNLSQLVPRSTRVTKTTELSIDVIITSNPHQVIETGVMPSSISDHDLPYVVIIQYNTIQCFIQEIKT